MKSALARFNIGSTGTFTRAIARIISDSYSRPVARTCAGGCRKCHRTFLLLIHRRNRPKNHHKSPFLILHPFRLRNHRRSHCKNHNRLLHPNVSRTFAKAVARAISNSSSDPLQELSQELSQEPVHIPTSNLLHKLCRCLRKNHHRFPTAQPWQERTQES